MHGDLDAVGVSGADADEQVFHQPAVFFAAGFEFRHRAEIDQSGIDGLTLCDAIQLILRAEADADIFDVDDGAVVHLESVFCFELGKAVGADGLEVGADRKDSSPDPFAENLPAEDRDDPPDTMAVIAGDDRGADLDGEAEDIFGLKRSCHRAVST
jgi:hypothetical protein